MCALFCAGVFCIIKSVGNSSRGASACTLWPSGGFGSPACAAPHSRIPSPTPSSIFAPCNCWRPFNSWTMNPQRVVGSHQRQLPFSSVDRGSSPGIRHASASATHVPEKSMHQMAPNVCSQWSVQALIALNYIVTIWYSLYSASTDNVQIIPLLTA